MTGTQLGKTYNRGPGKAKMFKPGTGGMESKICLCEGAKLEERDDYEKFQAYLNVLKCINALY